MYTCLSAAEGWVFIIFANFALYTVSKLINSYIFKLIACTFQWIDCSFE